MPEYTPKKFELPKSGKRITYQNGELCVPDNPIIPFIEGDGTGPDIWRATVRVVDAAVEKTYRGTKKIHWYEIYAGEKAYTLYNDWAPQDTFDAIRYYYVAIKGPLTTPVSAGFRSLNVTLRQKLDLYTCLRPVRYFEGVPSPVKHPEDVDMVVFRENSEDIYAGIEWEAGSEGVKKLITFLQGNLGVSKIRFPATSAIGIKPISSEGTERLVRSAIRYALAHHRKSITLVHKGNIMKFTEGGFKNWGYALAECEFKDQVFTWAQYDRIKAEQGEEAANTAQQEALAMGRILIKDVICDAFLQQILTRPKEYDVIATMNLNGDYISDALAAQVGGIGIAPGANINYETGRAVFEATHGTAPKYAGQDKVNPGSVILSAGMMLEYLEWQEAADNIIAAMTTTIKQKIVTYDFARLMEDAQEVKCSEFGEAIIKNLA